jgi:peptidoglycan/LPS O-acetylase OafA/YrhL
MAAHGAKTGQLRTLQCLRAIAALFVVCYHTTVLWRDKFDPGARPWENGASGVDLFFVISGFIMVVSSAHLAGSANGWRQFIVNRLIRIVPLYWLATTAARIMSIMAVGGAALYAATTAWNTTASYLFIPSFDANGFVRPVLVVGWTLSFEMMFYAVFAAALVWLVNPLVVIGPIMLSIALLALLDHTGWPAFTTLASPIVLEFVFGVVLGQTYVAGRIRSPLWAFLAASGLLCLMLIPAHGFAARTAVWGSAAAATLYGSVLCEPWLGRRLPGLVVRIGEASYSLYLTHLFVLSMVGFAAARTGLTGPTLRCVLLLSCLAASTFVSLVVHQWVEAPITRHLRQQARIWRGLEGRAV